MENPLQYRTSGSPFLQYFPGPTVEKTSAEALRADPRHQALEAAYAKKRAAWAPVIAQLDRLMSRFLRKRRVPEPPITSGKAPAHDAFEGSVSV